MLSKAAPPQQPKPKAKAGFLKQALDKIEEDLKGPSSKPKKKRTLEQMNTDEQVEEKYKQSIRDNFKGWEDVDLTGVVRGGLTLTKRLKRDIRLKLKGDVDPDTGKKVVMGAPYYRELKALYMRKKPELEVLLPKNAPVEEKLNQDLALAVAAIEDAKPNRGPFEEYLKKAPTVNKKDACCVLTVSLGFAYRQLHDLLLSVLRFVAKHNIHTRFPLAFAACKDHLSNAMVEIWKKMAKSESDQEEYLQTYDDVVYVLLPRDDVGILLSEGSDWGKYCDSLARVADAGPLGLKLFGHALVHVSTKKVSEIIDANIATLKGKALTQAGIGALTEKIKKELKESVPKLSAVPAKRMVSFAYRRMDGFTSCVESIDQEISLKLNVFIKTVAVEQEDLQAMSMEFEMAPQGAVLQKIDIGPELLRKLTRARDSANNAINGEAWTTGHGIVEVLSRKEVSLKRMDPFFMEVEAQLYKSMLGDRGETRLQDQILEAFPSAKKCCAVEETASKLSLIRRSDFFRFCNSTAQSLLNVVVTKFVSKIEVGEPPEFDFTEDVTEFYYHLRERLPYFVKPFEEEVTNGGKTETTTVFGKEALAKWLEHANKKAQEEKLTIDDLDIFAPFDFLLDNSQKESIDTLTRDLLKSMEENAEAGETSVAPKPSSSPSASASVGSASKKPKEDAPTKEKALQAVLAKYG